LKISLAAESSTPVLGDGVGVDGEKERVAMMAERVVPIRGQKVEVNDLAINTGGREAERVDGRVEGHCRRERGIAVAGRERFLSSGCAQGEKSGCKQAQLIM
jgi:hypothetical protein